MELLKKQHIGKPQTLVCGLPVISRVTSYFQESKIHFGIVNGPSIKFDYENIRRA